MKKYVLAIFFILLGYMYAQQFTFEEIPGEEFGLDEINNRATYVEIAEQLKQIFLQIDEAVATIKQNNVSLIPSNYVITDMGTEEFNTLKLSEQLKIFQQNYTTMNNFTKGSLKTIQNNSQVFNEFCGLQIQLMSTFGLLLDEADRIQKSQEEDLRLALSEIEKTQDSTVVLKSQLEICKVMAEEQMKEIARIKKRERLGWSIGTAGVIIGIIGVVVGATPLVNKCNRN